jgi:hypothetical protein
MAQHAKSGRERSIDEVSVIVDSDAHVTESVDQLLPYLEPEE